jgi:hypothetical protein
MPIAWQTMHATVDRRVIFKNPAVRADAAWRVRRIGRKYGLLVFHLGTDHIHTVVTCTRAEVPKYAHALECSLTKGCGLAPGFARYHPRAIADQGHLERIYDYVLGQERHHRTELDLEHIGSNGPDLLGWRLCGAPERRRLRSFAPRIRTIQIERLLLRGRRRLSIEQMGAAPHGLHGAELERLLSRAAASALGRSSLRGQTVAVLKARRALLEILRTADLQDAIELTRLFGGQRRLARLASREVDPEVAGAVRRMIEFHVAIAGPRPTSDQR